VTTKLHVRPGNCHWTLIISFTFNQIKHATRKTRTAVNGKFQILVHLLNSKHILKSGCSRLALRYHAGGHNWALSGFRTILTHLARRLFSKHVSTKSASSHVSHKYA
jgi:hypothetical protein